MMHFIDMRLKFNYLLSFDYLIFRWSSVSLTKQEATVETQLLVLCHQNLLLHCGNDPCSFFDILILALCSLLTYLNFGILFAVAFVRISFCGPQNQRSYFTNEYCKVRVPIYNDLYSVEILFLFFISHFLALELLQYFPCIKYTFKSLNACVMQI